MPRPNNLLPDLLGEIIKDQEGKATFEAIEKLRQGFIKLRLNPDAVEEAELIKYIESLDLDTLDRVIHGFTAFFHLVNIDEELTAQQQRQQLELNDQTWRNSFVDTLQQFKQQGVTYDQLQQLLSKLNYYPTFTAHPTEAKRPAVLEALQRIHQCYKNHQQSGISPKQQSELRQRLKAMIQILWKTESVRPQKPSVYDEIENSLFFFRRSLFSCIPDLYRDLEYALKSVYPEACGKPLKFSRLLQFGTWVGGDRDGNPFVTTEITRDALRIQHCEILQEYINRVEQLSTLLTHSIEQIQLSNELAIVLEQQQQQYQQALGNRFQNEPYRRMLAFCKLRLEANLQQTHNRLQSINNSNFEQNDLSYQNEQQFSYDLELIANSLISHNEANLTRGKLQDLRYLLDCCGFHLSKMDIRQESSLHTRAVHEVAINSELQLDYQSLDEQARIKWLSEQLLSNDKLDYEHRQLSVQSTEIIEVFSLIKVMREEISPNCIGSYIISMTHQASHVLEVAFLAKLSGLWLTDASTNLQITPLFETVDDLERADQILESLFNDPAYQILLNNNQQQQEIMLGYSDSCKDGGILASGWNLYQAQQRIVASCKKHNVSSLLFHGRGGTISRGGGPTHESILSQPPGTVQNQIKFTEQGEVLSFKYNLAETARYELTVGISALMKASLKTEIKAQPANHTELITQLIDTGEQQYRALTDNNQNTMEYFYQTTPSQEIALLNIGSRPSHRKKADRSKKSIRAIGWVFGWSQSRQNIPGWYGLGSALQKLIDAGKLEQLQAMHQQWRFFQNLISNSEMVALKTDQRLAAHYAALCTHSFAEPTYQQLKQEFETTVNAIKEVTQQAELMADYPEIAQSVTWRNAYLDPLNFIQVMLLKRLSEETNRLESEYLKPTLNTINGIATGLRNTG